MVRPHVIAAAAVVLVVLSHTTSYNTCDALRFHGPHEEGSAASAGGEPSSGDLYRPPIIDIQYGGGRILWKPIRLYFIWYGAWTDAQKEVIRTATNSLTPSQNIRDYPNLSNYWRLVTEYHQDIPGEGRKYGSNKVSIAGEIDDSYSFGHTIDANRDPYAIIVSHVDQDLPIDLEQGVYFIFTSSDVSFTNVGDFCGYHSSACFNPSNSDCTNAVNHIVYSFVTLGLPDCSSFGDALTGPPPNNNVDPSGALDSMIITYLHELLELAVDPYLDGLPMGWTGIRGNVTTEAADLCAYSFVAGDYYYCKLTGLYPDFTGSPCLSLYNHHKALTAPGSGETFNVYGIQGSKFIVQQFWSLGTKGCALQFEQASCPARTVALSNPKGTIQRGLFSNGVGLQRYAAGGQSCTWNIAVRGAKRLFLTFDTVALGYDALDYVSVRSRFGNERRVTGFGTNIKLEVVGNSVTIHFVSNGRRSPYPSSAGFIMHYEAGF